MAYSAQDYGFVQAFLSKYPDVAKLVNAAIKAGTTPEKFAFQFQNSSWYKARSEAQRAYDIMAYNDPAEAKRQVDARRADLERLAQQMGIQYSASTMNSWALSSVRGGIDEDDMRAIMAGAAGAITDEMIAGEAKGATEAAVTSLRRMAADYGVPVSNATLLKQVQDVVGGKQTADGYADLYREQAKKQYTAIADQLDAGMTVRQIADPYLDIASEELGVSSSAMELTDPRWTAMFQGDKVLAYQDWQRKLRTEKQYGWDRTSKAREESMRAILGLGRMFGTVG